MTLVESCTITGDVYEVSGFDGRVLIGPWGAFEVTDENEFVGKIVAFQADQFGERERVEGGVEIDAYMASESLFVPIDTVSEYRLGGAYVIDGERLVSLGDAHFLRPEVLGGEQTSEQVIEVFTHAFRTPFSASERMEADLVSEETVVEVFQESEVELVEPVGN